MTVHVAIARKWDTGSKSDSVAGVFLTLTEAMAALEQLHGEALQVIHHGFAWAVDHRGVEVGYCVEAAVGEQLTTRIAEGT
jgi:hypothetical protein